MLLMGTYNWRYQILIIIADLVITSNKGGQAVKIDSTNRVKMLLMVVLEFLPIVCGNRHHELDRQSE